MERSSFFNSISGDRKYKADDWARYFASFIGNGVFPLPATGLQVAADYGMNVIVKAGRAFINGYFYENTSDLSFQLQTADGTRNRIDRVVVRWSLSQRKISVQIKSSAYSTGVPTPTALERTADIYELALADIRVNAGVAWLECKESDGTHKPIIDLYNSHKPLARSYPVKYTDAWCSTFVSAVAIKCGLTDIIPTECGCEKHIELFKKLGSWQEDGKYIPMPGDVLFYNWDTSAQPNDGYADHVGIVEKISGGNVVVIEGNYSNAVKRRTLAIGHGNIRGYGLPKYASKATPEPVTPAPTTKENEKEEIEVPRYNKLADMPAYAKPTIQKMIDKGYLKGSGTANDENGLPADLDLSLDMIRVFVAHDRAGLYKGTV